MQNNKKCTIFFTLITGKFDLLTELLLLLTLLISLFLLIKVREHMVILMHVGQQPVKDS
jgi:hypothetical protein